MKRPTLIGLAAAMIPALASRRIGEAIPHFTPPAPRVPPPPPPEPRRPLSRRTPEQTTLHRMTNWQNHQWMKAGCPRGKRLQEFAELQFGHALPPKGKSA